jgi:DNA-binding XRE family transcriptional regulator
LPASEKQTIAAKCSTFRDTAHYCVAVNAHRNPPKDPLDHEPSAVTYARAQAGLTKTQLAEACGVSVSLISEIEAGTRNATPAMILKLAAALNCPRVILERKRENP